jgi:hypothetical protein
MANKMFYTTGYRGYHIHCTVEGNRETCQIQAPDLSLVARTSSSPDAAKKRIRKLAPKKGK